MKCHVERRPRPDAEEVVAFALLCVDRAAGEEARSPLQALAPIHLAEVVLAYYDFLLDQAGGSEPTFSEFALLLRDTVPETFVEILVSLVRNRSLSFFWILQLCKSSQRKEISEFCDFAACGQDLYNGHPNYMLEVYMSPVSPVFHTIVTVSWSQR